MSNANLQTAPRPDVVRFPSPAPMPTTWLIRLVRAVGEGDRPLETTARRELRRLGYRVAVDRRNRKGGPL